MHKEAPYIVKYDLVGIVVHYGGFGGGHYICISKRGNKVILIYIFLLIY